jgi:hypothetical protein
MLRRTCALVSIAFALSLLSATGAATTAKRTFVASYGAPANTAFNCSITKPCRAFNDAISVTSASGEVIVLDSAGYGPVTITQSVSIIAPAGVYAGISVFSGDGVTVTAGVSDKVVVRGLTINGQGGNNGIVVTGAGQVHIEDCLISNLAADGIRIDGGSAVHIAGSTVRSNGGNGLNVAAGTPAVEISNTRFAHNANFGVLVAAGNLDGVRVIAENNDSFGVVASPAAATTVVVTMSDSTFNGNGFRSASLDGGFAANSQTAGGVVNAALHRSTAARNNGIGFVGFAAGSGALTLAVGDSGAVENGAGIQVVGANATAIVSGNIVAHNGAFDLGVAGSAIMRTSTTNALTGRGAGDVSGSLTPNPQK